MEFSHIDYLRHHLPVTQPHVIRSIGDDCAVIDQGNTYQLVTADMLVEGDHFRLDWSTPEQVGIKAMEVCISDISAMGGIPQYAFVSLCLTGKEKEDFIPELYKGLLSSCHFSKDYPDINILGGDITHGSNVVINVTLMGMVEKERCIFRNGAQVGDLIGVTESLGASWAGLEYLRKHQPVGTGLNSIHEPWIEYCLTKHRTPQARFESGRILSKYASAMIDVSDGLGSEVRHIAKESGKGAVVYKTKIPIREEVKKMGEYIKKDPFLWAFSGGEDFELVFTVSPEKLTDLEKENLDFTIVGEVTGGNECILIDEYGEKQALPKGYEHQV